MDENKIIGLKPGDNHHDATAERKSQLLRQGEFYRVGAVHAKASIKHAVKPEVMFHAALDHATFALRTRVDSVLRPTGINVATIMPYAMTVLGFLQRRRLLKPAAGVLAAAAGVAYYVRHRYTSTSLH